VLRWGCCHVPVLVVYAAQLHTSVPTGVSSLMSVSTRRVAQSLSMTVWRGTVTRTARTWERSAGFAVVQPEVPLQRNWFGS